MQLLQINAFIPMRCSSDGESTFPQKSQRISSRLFFLFGNFENPLQYNQFAPSLSAGHMRQMPNMYSWLTTKPAQLSGLFYDFLCPHPSDLRRQACAAGL
jgi:hypothetical protein